MSDATPAPDGSPPETVRFRWQGLFERSADPLFVLDRRRRLVFVNRAWEILAGISAADATGLVCRHPESSTHSDSPEVIVAHALTPPRWVQERTVRVRRLLPGPGACRRWWDVDFLPVRVGSDRTDVFILGRIIALSDEA